MATTSTPRVFKSFICQTCRQRLAQPSTTARRAFTTTSAQRAEDYEPLSSPAGTSQPSGLTSLSQSLGNSTVSNRRKGFNNSAPTESLIDILDKQHNPLESLLSGSYGRSLSSAAAFQKPYRMHILATKHNTHITFVQPPRSAAETASSNISATSASASDQKKQIDVLLSLSTGNIGFRKAGRGSYDAAYQLAAFVLKQIQEKGMLRQCQKLEVVLRGFGAGREAVTKALLGAEGRNVRGKITAVVDATRLKLGGPRSKKPRRLG